MQSSRFGSPPVIYIYKYMSRYSSVRHSQMLTERWTENGAIYSEVIGAWSDLDITMCSYYPSHCVAWNKDFSWFLNFKFHRTMEHTSRYIRSKLDGIVCARTLDSNLVRTHCKPKMAKTKAIHSINVICLMFVCCWTEHEIAGCECELFETLRAHQIGKTFEFIWQ